MRVHRLALSELPSRPAWLEGCALFSSAGFMKLWLSVGGEPVYIAVESDKKLVAALPGAEFGVKGFKSFQAMPNGCYSRILTDPDFSSRTAELVGAILDYLAGAGYAKVYITDYYRIFGEDDRYESQAESTLLLDISTPDWEPPDRKLRQQVRKGVREERHVVRFDPDKNMADMLHLVSLSAARQGRKPFYTPAFYEQLARLAASDDRVWWRWMEHDGRPVASSIFLAEGEQLLHWLFYFDEELSHLQPSKILPYLAARDWAAAGGKYLNLGASPPDVPGVLEYKRKWGGEEYRYHTLVRRAGLGRLL